MGALPSRESNEDPSSVFFANCGSHVVFHVPMTSHYFPSPNSLAFRQLYHARNHQSALYCFDMKDVSPVMPADVAAAFHEAQEEDWGEEVDETDPSLYYCDEEIREKLREFRRNADANSKDASTGTSAPRSPRVGRHLRPSIADREELYRVLVTEPMEGTLVDTDAEMCALFEQEQRWRAALPHLANRQQQQGRNSSRRCKINHGHGFDEKDPDHAPPDSGASATNQQSHNEGVKRGRGAAAANGIGDAKAETPSLPVAEPPVSSVSPPPPPPPGKFLYPLPRAIALRLTTEEEEEMRAEYCRQHGIPYVAPAFRSVGAATGNDTAADVGGSAAAAPHVAPPTPLPVVERRHYHFEDDPLYRDGRVHLVEEHGVLYHFCYFAKQPSQTGTTVAVAAASSSRGSQEGETTEGAAATGVMAAGTTPISPTPIVRGRCLHDVVYCEEPSASLVSSSKNVVASSSESPGSELEVVAPVRYSRCARCGERVTQRMDYTQLRRLKSTRAHRRAVRERLPDGGQDSPETKNRMDEVSPHTERVEEEGEEEFIINIMPVRVVGMDGLLPSRCRGTPWLRGYGQEREAAEDAYIEQLGQKPPVMRVCRFIEGSVGDKIVNRAALLTLLSYRPMCQQAGLRDVLTRPIWSMCALSNIPYLQMVRETFFRAKAAVAEVDDDDLLLRRWLDVVDRDNNFYNFINANLHMTRNCTPPERTVRQREQTDNTASAGTASSRRTINGGGGVREGGSVGTNLADSSSLVSPLLPKTAVYPAVGDASRPSESLAVHPDTSVSGAVALPSPQGASPNPCCAADSPPPTTSSATPQLGDDVANSAVAASESAERARQTTSATAQCVCGKKNDRDGDWKPAESNGTDLCSRHLTRALEEATIGRPEGHGPRDQVDEEDDDDEDADEEGREEGASDNEIAVDAAVRRGKGNKTQHKVVELSSQCFDDPSLPASSADQCATNSAAVSISPCTEDMKEMRDNGRGVAVATSMMGERPDAVSSPYGAHRHRSGGTKDSDNASGEAGDTSTTTTGILPSAASPSTPIRQWRGGDDDAMKLSINNLDDDEDPDLCTEEERRPSRASVARTSAMGDFPLERATASSTGAAEAHTTANQSPTAAKPSQQQQQQRPGVPPRPNFQLFSSRLEPHAPLSLCTLFDCDTRTDQAAKRTVTQLAAAAAAVEADVGTGHHSKASSRDDDGAGHVSAATSAAAEAATTVWPSYVQRDILRENERQQAEPKAMRRPSHALYECGMLTTTRGRNFLFLLREDCVQALLYYCSTAAAPIFIGAYIEPVDTTSLSYGGAVRLQRPSTVDIPLDGGGEDDGSCAVPARNYDGHRVVLGQVEGMEVIAEYFKSKGLITCFSVSDVDKAAPGPSAAHRLRKMILPTTSSSTLHSQHYRSSTSGVLAEEAGSLAVRQARELAQYSHVFTYAADDFCDGDLVVFNFEERRWEHYEHVQLRRRFAAKAAADAADVVTTAASSMPVNTSAPTSTGNVAAATCDSQNFTNSDMDPSMSARLLCVGLDELLLSWTKWIVDNRFYEDRTDLGWLRLPDGSPIQLGDRYFLWSFRHNHQRYFYGVIPKFAKGRLRRQKMMERIRSKKAAEALRPPAPPQAGLLAVSPVRTRRSTDGRVPSSPPSSPAHVAASAIAPPGPTSSSGIRSRWACETPEAKPTEEPRLCGDGTDTRSLHVDPALGCPASSPLVHRRLATPSSSRAGATQQTPPQKAKLSTSAAPQAVSTAAASSAHSTAMRQCQPHSSPHQVQQPTLQRISITATASFVSAAPTTAGEQAQQGSIASSLNCAGSLPVRVGTRALRPILCSPKNAAGSLTTTATTVTTAAHRSLFLSPSLHHSVNGSGNRPSTHSSILPIGLGGGPNYYYQYGGNTFIQDGKRHENEYYPPLPTSTAFHPVTAITKFVPLPHPKTERGGIPPVFRFWGPIGSPAPRTPAPTASWGAIPTLLVPQQAHLLSPRHPTTGSPAAGSAVNGGEGVGVGVGVGVSMGVGVGQVGAQHHTSGFNLSAGPCAALATAPASAMAAAGASSVNLTVRVRRRTLGGNTARKAAIGVGGSASLAPLPPASPSVSSLGASRTPGTVTGPGTPFRHSPLAPSTLPTPSRVTQPAPTQLLANDSELQRLSPTSMLPANLINEGSKTKGESVLRVDEDTYMQREAFRWNPYASTKWAQNRSSSAGGSVSGAGGSHSVEGGSGRC